jgi:hypothetical protein
MAAQNPERDITVLAAQTALLAEQNRARELDLDPTVLAALTALRAAQAAVLAEKNRARELDKKSVRYSNLRCFL